MKKIFYILLITQLTAGFSYSQSGWFWQNPLPQGNFISDMFIMNNRVVCSNHDNILKSINGGINWQMSYTGHDSIISGMYFVNQNTGYIILDSSSVFKTTNFGNNWFFISKIPLVGSPLTKFINVNTGFVIGVGTNYRYYSTKMLRTSDGGFNWVTVIEDDSNRVDKLTFINNLTGFAAGSKYDGNHYSVKVMKTTNSGNTWDSIPNSIIDLSVSCMEFINVNTGFIGGQYSPASTASGKILKTTNGGLNWELQGFTFGQYVGKIIFFDTFNGYIISDYWYYKTTNGGESWAYFPFNYGGYHDIGNVYFTDMNTCFAVGYGGLIIKTTNRGTNWTKVLPNGENKTFYDVKFADESTGFAAGDYGEVLRTTDGGLNWNLIQFNVDGFNTIAMVDRNIWYLGSFGNGKVFKTTNTGLTWDTLPTNHYGITRIDFINALTGFGICKYSYFFKTTNGGSNWIINDISYYQNWALDFIDENTGWIGGARTAKTTNGGENWNRVYLSNDFYTEDIQFINKDTGFIAGIIYSQGGFISKTTDGGKTWNNKIISYYEMNDIFFVNSRIGFALNYGELFKTTDCGENWFQVRTCSYNPHSSVFFPDTLTGYIAGYYGTIIKTTNGGGKSIEEIPPPVPSGFSLSQNYPNPFNPVTKIKFEIPEQSHVKLIVYDLLGRQMVVLVNSELTPDFYEVQWNGSNYASGIYFYRLETDPSTSSGQGFTQTKKMVLLK